MGRTVPAYPELAHRLDDCDDVLLFDDIAFRISCSGVGYNDECRFDSAYVDIGKIDLDFLVEALVDV